MSEAAVTQPRTGVFVQTSDPLWTTADVDRLPDVEGIRYEIIRGELIVSKSPGWEHQRTCANILFELEQWNREAKLAQVAPAPGVLFSRYDNVMPDVVWASQELLRTGLDDTGHLIRSPELVIEVLSLGRANIERDRETKREIYDQYGVDEYWITDWRIKHLYIHRRVDGALRQVASRVRDELVRSPLLPGFRCPVSRFFS